MPEAGQSLLHYRLIETIGEGGMGVVWKALDTSLGRDVAIKVLPEALVRSADRVARLEREARLLGSLNHPNVATVHGLHADPRSGGTRFLVMELVEGEDLSKRIARGALPAGEAIEIARQIAEGLEAAHAAGIIHRDLKPANVKVIADGRVKVLDFGLARAVAGDPASGDGETSPTLSPTLTSAGTLAGTILGTAAYMSPEQARGHPVDGRADVWAFGVVLYEMLAGRAAFKGETVSDTLAAILKLDPDFDALPADVPQRVRRLVARCLQKDRKQRLHHIADARLLLEEAQAGDLEEPAAVDPLGRARERVLWIAAAVLLAIGAAAATWALRPEPSPAPHRKILLALDGHDPDDPELYRHEISPDGRRLAYRNGKKVFVRDLDNWASREIASAEGAGSIFWSHDGSALGFHREKELWRVSPDGGAAAKIGDVPGSLGGPSWGPGGEIVLVGTHDEKTGLWALPERGGEPREMFRAEEGTHFHSPHVLPGGRGVLVAVHARPEMRIAVVANGELRTMSGFETTYLPGPIFSSTGHILYFRGGTNRGIWALPFSLETLEPAGESFLVEADAGSASVSRDGTLVFTPQTASASRRLVWVDRQGTILETLGEPAKGLHDPSLSPDGRRLAVSSGEEDERDVWIVDLERGTFTRLTFEEGREQDPLWMPDGSRIVYVHQDENEDRSVKITDADGTGEPEILEDAHAFSLSPDGRYLVTTPTSDETRELRVRDLGREGEPLRLAASERVPGRISPDGAYIAYVSDESGRFEVYLRRFPSGTGKWQASVEGGYQPRWSPKGDELFWVQGETLMVVDVESGPPPKLGTPRALFEWKHHRILGHLGFDVAAEARRFVLVAPEKDPEPTPNRVMLVENWVAGL